MGSLGLIRTESLWRAFIFSACQEILCLYLRIDCIIDSLIASYSICSKTPKSIPKSLCMDIFMLTLLREKSLYLLDFEGNKSHMSDSFRGGLVETA